MNEEASRALREAPQEVQRMMLQEVQVGAEREAPVGGHGGPSMNPWKIPYISRNMSFFCLEFLVVGGGII